MTRASRNMLKPCPDCNTPVVWTKVDDIRTCWEQAGLAVVLRWNGAAQWHWPSPEMTWQQHVCSGPQGHELMYSGNLLRWLASGPRGISSNTMIMHLTGIPTMGRGFMDHPHDSDDFRRCRLLLEQVPELQAKLPAMATCSPAWKALIEHWAELCALMDGEIADWRGNIWAFGERTSARIKALEQGASHA